MRRRHFTGFLASFPLLGVKRRDGGTAGRSLVPTPLLTPFPLDRVKLLPGPFLEATLVNRRFLMAQDPDRLLHMFRITAGLPSTAEPLGGWEAPDNELRGHYTGHYLSACAKFSASMGDSEIKARGNLLVTELARCQEKIGTGYLSAFPEEVFDHGRPAGHASARRECPGHDRGPADGGMGEPLGPAAGRPRDGTDSGARVRRDERGACNGVVRAYELTGDRRYHDIASYFWHQVTSRRCYCTGGTSNRELWGSEPGVVLKPSRHIMGWTADPEAAAYYERALWNGTLTSQHPSDGSKLYYVPLVSGYWKQFGTPYHDYWCCTGTMSESFSTLNDSIYFHDERGVFVNLFASSELDWKEPLAIRIRVPSWTSGGSARLNGRLLEGFATPGGYYVIDRTWRDGERIEVRFPLRLHLAPMPDDPRIPAVMYGPLVLVGKLGTAGLNSETLRAEPTKPRTVPEFKIPAVAAPSFRVSSDEPTSWIRPLSHPLEFETFGQERNVTLVPFYRLYDERYAVYWEVTR
jgi:DUF1680 family protein